MILLNKFLNIHFGEMLYTINCSVQECELVTLLRSGAIV